MRINYIVCPEYTEDKLESKHLITVREARQVLLNNARIRFAEKGNTPGDDVYVAFGQSFGGRYLAVYFVYKPKTATAIIISARNMKKKEQRRYGRK